MSDKKGSKKYGEVKFSKKNSGFFDDSIAKKEFEPKKICSFYPHEKLFLFPVKLIGLFREKLIIFPDGRHQPISDFLRIGPLQLEPSELGVVCQQICEMVQVFLYSRKSSPKMSDILIDVPDSVHLFELELSSRARVSLQSRDFFSPYGPWRHCTLKDIVSTHAMGARLLLAFLLAIENRVRYQKENELIQGPGNKKTDCVSVDVFVSNAKPATHLEDDLAHLSKSVLYSDRSASIFCLSNGWDGGGNRSLSELSILHDISKERVRQVLSSSQRSMQKYAVSTNPPKRLSEAIRLLELNSPVCIEKSGHLFKDSGLSRSNFNSYGVLSASKIFGFDTPLRIHKLGRTEIVCRPEEKNHIEALQCLGRSMVRSLGLVNEQWVWLRALEASSSVKMDHVHLAMISDKDMMPLVVDSTGSHWFWTGRCGNPNGAIVRPLKIIAFLGECSLKEMLRDINSETSLADIDLPGIISDEVLCALLSRWGMSEKENCLDQIWTFSDDKSRQVCQSALPSVERQIAQIIKNAGGSLNRSKFQKIAHDQSINSNTFQSYLRRSPLFFRPGKKISDIFLTKSIAIKEQESS